MRDTKTLQGRRRQRNQRPKAVDLFSGCGGMSLGLRQAGFEVCGAVDNDSLSVETYRKNHPNVKIWETDIGKLTVSRMMKELGINAGDLDLLVGCPPCQGFSAIRTLNGGRRVRDIEKDLVFEFLRFVRVLRPKAVMMENVPGLMTDRRMRTIIRELKKLNYTCNHGILDAADYGVPQRRKRFILLASLSGRIDFAPRCGKKHTVREAIGRLPAVGRMGDPLHDIKEKRSGEICQLIRLIRKDGGSRRSLGKKYQLPCHKNSDGFKDVYGRMTWDEVAPTITGGCTNPSKGRFLHPRYDRAITLREAALLQSFPRKYFFSLQRGKYAAAALIGNALPPRFIKRQARQVIAHLNRNREST